MNIPRIAIPDDRSAEEALDCAYFLEHIVQAIWEQHGPGIGRELRAQVDRNVRFERSLEPDHPDCQF